MHEVLRIARTRRSIRRFQQRPIGRDVLTELVDTARYAPAAANNQPLEYVIIDRADLADAVFKHLAWAARVRPRRTPGPGQQPVAYVIVLRRLDRELGTLGPVDAAAAIQTMLLAAWAMGIGSCWLGAIDRRGLRDLLNIPESHEIDSVIALGYPAEAPVAEDARSEETAYYLDETDVLHVPKRPLQAILHVNGFGTSGA